MEDCGRAGGGGGGIVNTTTIEDLFKRIQLKNISVPYNCSTCGNIWAIDGDSQSNGCEVCGEEIDIYTLNEFVKILL